MSGTRGLAAGPLAEAQRSDQSARVLVKIAATAGDLTYIDQAVPWVDAGEDPDVTYTPRGIELGDIVHDNAGSTQLSILIDDVDLALYTVNQAEGLTGLSVTVTRQLALVGTPMTGTWQTEYSCTWQVRDAIIDPGQDVTLTLGPGSGDNCRHGLAEGSRSCPHIYGDGTAGVGIRCQVATATLATYPTCNKTWADCVLRSNTGHNGSDRHAPEPGETIKWTTADGTVTSTMPDSPEGPAAMSGTTFSNPLLNNGNVGLPPRLRRPQGRFMPGGDPGGNQNI